ncbi:hypothetical protein FDENT_14214, partial [Fusarium denticulatum]
VPSPATRHCPITPPSAVAPKRLGDMAATLTQEANKDAGQLFELIEPCFAQAPKLQAQRATIDGRETSRIRTFEKRNSTCPVHHNHETLTSIEANFGRCPD